MELEHDRDVVIVAIRQNGDALRFSSEELYAQQRCPHGGRQASWLGASVSFGGLKHVRDMVVEAVRQHGRALRFASEELYARQGCPHGGRQAGW